ncbi:MAG: hypothetical protein IJY03_07150 [Prevotella sp.]|nr:hypothetical protein [Prevotella sp.]
MKRINYRYCIALPIVILFLLWLNDVMSYSRRIGNTHFYLVESTAIPKEGNDRLVELCYKSDRESGGFSGVSMPGYPKTILWNDKYLISKNYDGYNEDIISYVVINQNSVNVKTEEIEEIYYFTSEDDYKRFLRQISLSEQGMNQTGNRILW